MPAGPGGNRAKLARRTQPVGDCSTDAESGHAEYTFVERTWKLILVLTLP